MGLFTRKISKKKLDTVNELLKESASFADAANKSVNPEVFFESYNMLEKKLAELINYEHYKIFRGNTPSRDLMRAQEQRQNEINAMIQRSYHHAKAKAEKTGQAMDGEVMREYFEHMEEFKHEMNKFNRKVMDDLKEITLGK